MLSKRSYRRYCSNRPDLGGFAEIVLGSNPTLTLSTAYTSLNFTANTKIGDGSIAVAGTNIILPSTGTYMIYYDVSGAVTSTGDVSSGTFGGVVTRLFQVGVGPVIDSDNGINIFGATALDQDGDDSLGEAALVSVSAIGTDNIVQLQVQLFAQSGPVGGFFIEGQQTSITIHKISNNLSAIY